MSDTLLADLPETDERTRQENEVGHLICECGTRISICGVYMSNPTHDDHYAEEWDTCPDFGGSMRSSGPVANAGSGTTRVESSTAREPIFSVTLSDCEVQTFRSGGPGGQNQNKRDTGVRIIHPPSGARGESREERSQLQNKKLAFRRMAEHPLFRAWVARQSHTHKEIEKRAEQWVEQQLADPVNVKLETWHKGRWVRVDQID